MTAIEPEGPPLRRPPAVMYTAASRVPHFRNFLGSAMRDLRGAWPTTWCFFRRSLTQRYRYSSLGIIWAFVPSVITALALIIGQKTRLISYGPVPPPFYGVFG